MEWNGGMDWNGGMEWNSGMIEHTHIKFTTQVSIVLQAM